MGVSQMTEALNALTCSVGRKGGAQLRSEKMLKTRQAEACLAGHRSKAAFGILCQGRAGSRDPWMQLSDHDFWAAKVDIQVRSRA